MQASSSPKNVFRSAAGEAQSVLGDDGRIEAANLRVEVEGPAAARAAGVHKQAERQHACRDDLPGARQCDGAGGPLDATVGRVGGEQANPEEAASLLPL